MKAMIPRLSSELTKILPILRTVIFSRKFLTGLLLIASLAGAGVAVILPNAYTYLVPPALFFSAVISFKQRETPEWPTINIDPRVPLLVYFVTVSGIVYTYYSSGVLVGRPWKIHLGLMVLYLLTIPLITSSAPRWVSISAIVLAASLHRGLGYYASATQYGLDALFHNRVVGEIAAQGTISPLSATSLAEGKYYFAPVYYALTAQAEIVTSATTRDVVFLIASLGSIVTIILIVYSLATTIFEEENGLYAALLIASADFALYWSLLPQPNLLGAVFFALILYFYIRYLKGQELIYLLLLLGFIVLQTITHQASIFITCTGLAALILLQTIGTENIEIPYYLSGFFAFLVLVVSWFVTRTGEGSQSFLEKVIAALVDGLTSAGGRSSTFPQSERYAVAGANALPIDHLVGLAILLFLAVLGMLAVLRYESRDKQVIGMMFAGVVGVYSFFIFSGPLISFSVGLPFRWFIFMYIPAVILAAYGLKTLSGEVAGLSNATTAMLLICLLAAPYIVSMGGSKSGAPDNPVLGGPGADRLGTTTQEEASYEFVTQYNTNGVVADKFARQQLQRHYTHPAESYQVDAQTHNITNPPDTQYLYRDYDRTDRGPLQIHHDNRLWDVRGPIPYPGGSPVYSNGRVEVIDGQNKSSQERAGDPRPFAQIHPLVIFLV
ncbi:glycosyltransferase family 39 protein [Natronomonas salina]|uniref:glycosyltransferase family 39 protein n=1 Tax=Natronomonas salina TaxID=1710540 RepID=UPI0015B6219B|nr:glycosyltransferase family 39 protein [Natronomonas salina]QLD88782.1 glycosyltransferase family 39 protein [Natronomonas salina]